MWQALLPTPQKPTVNKMTLGRIRKKCACMHTVLLCCVGGVVGKCVSENRWEK